MSNDFLQQLTSELIKNQQKVIEQENKERIKGYHQCIVPPDLNQLHQRAVIEAQRRKSEEFEIEAIENEMYLKELKKTSEEQWEQKDTARSNTIQERARKDQNAQDSKFISQGSSHSEQWEVIEEEAQENEKYWKEHPLPELEIVEDVLSPEKPWKPKDYLLPDNLEEIEREAQENEAYRKNNVPEAAEEPGAYNRPETLDAIEQEAVQNEKYGKDHPSEAQFYTPPALPPFKELSDYDLPRVFVEPKPQLRKEIYNEKSIISNPPQPQGNLPPIANKIPKPPRSQASSLQENSKFRIPQESFPSSMMNPSKTKGFIKPLRKEEIPDTKTGLAIIKECIQDPAITYIDCPGPLKPITIKRMGNLERPKILLDENGILQVVKEFSEASRIPYTEGTFKAIVEDLLITAVISENIGSRFVITRLVR